MWIAASNNNDIFWGKARFALIFSPTPHVICYRTLSIHISRRSVLGLDIFAYRDVILSYMTRSQLIVKTILSSVRRSLRIRNWVIVEKSSNLELLRAISGF